MKSRWVKHTCTCINILVSLYIFMATCMHTSVCKYVSAYICMAADKIHARDL